MIPYRYGEQRPTAHLSLFIECFWFLETFTATGTEVWPDGCVDIVFSPEFGVRAVGAMTKQQVFALGARNQTIGVRFHPGMARAFLGISPAEFTDSFLHMEDLWPQRGKELKTRLAESQTISDCMEVLRRAVGNPEPAITPVQRAIQSMSSAYGNVDLHSLAQQANLSPRHFRRKCREEAGLTPKHLCRILRFRQAGQLAKASSKVNWSKIAAETGYFDQAHLIRDFREFIGQTPMSAFSNTAPATLA